MSLESWRKEFYPVPAKSTMRMDVIGIIKHSFHKWIGLSPKNLKRHGLERYEDGISDDMESFSTGNESCSLCKKYLDVTWPIGQIDCSKCPITKMRGYSCSKEYKKFYSTGENQPMVDLLEETLSWATVEELKKEDKRKMNKERYAKTGFPANTEKAFNIIVEHYQTIFLEVVQTPIPYCR